MSAIRALTILAMTTLLTGCGDEGSTPSAADPSATEGPLSIQVIGDSALEWNLGESTGNQLSEVLDERGVTHTLSNHAVGGATIGCGEGGIGTEENCIPPQYDEGDWTHVLISGGGNDILESGCTLEAEALISAELNAGVMVSVIEGLIEAGHQVLLYGYFLPLDPSGEAGSCPALVTLLERYRALGEAREEVTYIDAGEVVQRTQPEYYADDIHPSVEGSRRIAEHIADKLGYPAP